MFKHNILQFVEYFTVTFATQKAVTVIETQRYIIAHMFFSSYYYYKKLRALLMQKLYVKAISKSVFYTDLTDIREKT